MLNSGMRSSLQVGVWRHQSDHALSILLASSWGRVNRLGRSYGTQASPFWLASWKSWEVKTRKSATFPSPLPPRLQWSGGGHRSSCIFPTLPPLASSVSYWLERAAPSKSEWRRPIPLWYMMMKLARKVMCDSIWLFFTYSRFYSRNIHFMKEYMKKKHSRYASWGIHIVMTKFLLNNCLSFRQ
jgi:hypothetical protein